MAPICAAFRSDQDVIDWQRRTVITKWATVSEFVTTSRSSSCHSCWNTPDKWLIEFIELALQFVEMRRFDLLFPSALRVRLPLSDEL